MKKDELSNLSENNLVAPNGDHKVGRFAPILFHEHLVSMFIDEISSFKACFLCSFPPLALLLSATGRSRIMFRKTFGTSMFSITAKRTVLVQCSHGSKFLICLTCSYIISIHLSNRAAAMMEIPLSICLSCHGSRFL
jgi:hypothetical protein